MFYTNNELLYHENQNEEALHDAKEKLERYLELEKGLVVDLEVVNDPGYPVIQLPKEITYHDLDDCFRPEISLKSFEGELLTLPNTKYVEVRHNFTEKENLVLQDEMVKAMIELKKVEAEKKQVVKSYQTKMDELEKRSFENAELIARGYEVKDIECKVLLNFEEGKKYYEDCNEIDTIRKVEALEKNDYQLQLFVKKEDQENKQISDAPVEEPQQEKEISAVEEAERRKKLIDGMELDSEEESF